MNKYGNKKTIIDDIKFDSKREADYYVKLRDSGVDFDRQVPFVLQKKFVNGNGEKIREVKYIADFVVYGENKKIERVIDVKGMRTDVYTLKKKWFECKYAPLVIEEV